MSSPTSSSSSIQRFYYKAFLADEGYSTEEENEEEVVSSAHRLAAKYAEHVNDPPHPILRRQYIERDRAEANARLMKDYFDEDPTYPDPKTF